MMVVDDFGEKKFVVAGVETAVFCEEFQDIGFLRFFGATRLERGIVRISGGLRLDAMIFVAASGN